MTERMNVAILIFPNVEVLDFAGPFEVFSRTRLVPGSDARRSDEHAPFRVFTVAATHEPISATGDLRVVPHHAFDDCPRIDLLIVPGGFGTRGLLQDEATLAWVGRIASEARITASVCTGSLLLAKAGLLDGRTATTHWAALDLLQSLSDARGGTIRVERDDRWVAATPALFTSAGVAAGIDMSFAIVEQLHGKAVADETAHYIEYRRAV
ncbi:MAG: DJ-1/PfpI family protein [Acidobacteria bacterium]|nr:DJ-1/PfpI family protein [Acidobacteriota bacterium]MBV9475772.1 DJ-1/PfpI family protein [Acidobacteriota bacterium]